MARIGIVEDLAASIGIIESHLHGTDHQLVSCHRTAGDALDALGDPTQRADVYILDISLPDGRGDSIIPRILRAYPDTEIIMHTVFEDATAIMRCIEAGATGYLQKGLAREEFLHAIRTVLDGESYLTGRVAKKVLSALRKGTATQDPSSLKLPETLTPREGEILLALVRGLSCKEIAKFLGISVHTVGNHLRKVYEKLQVNSRSEAVAKLVSGDDGFT